MYKTGIDAVGRYLRYGGHAGVIHDDGVAFGVAVAAAVAVYVCTFAVFDKPFTLMNALIESLPVIGFVVLNQGYRLKDAAATRRLALICSSCWLIYNSVNFAIGGMLCEIFSLISIFTAMYRLDRKKG